MKIKDYFMQEIFFSCYIKMISPYCYIHIQELSQTQRMCGAGWTIRMTTHLLVPIGDGV